MWYQMKKRLFILQCKLEKRQNSSKIIIDYKIMLMKTTSNNTPEMEIHYHVTLKC